MVSYSDTKNAMRPIAHVILLLLTAAIVSACAFGDCQTSPREGWLDIDSQNKTPAAKSETPTPNPEIPTPNSEIPTPNPEIPTPNPEIPTPNPEIPTPNPEIPTPNPEIPTPNPEIPTPNPEIPTPNPEIPTPNPEIPTPSHPWAQPLEMPGLPNLHKVSETVYRSAQPESGAFESAQKLGIRTILNIQLLDQDTYLAQQEPTSLELVHIPMTPIYFPEDQIVQAMQVIIKNPPVLVHCRHGADRTGLIIAIYRILYQNWTVDEAKDELINGGFGFHESFENIPQELDKIDFGSLRTQLGLQ